MSPESYVWDQPALELQNGMTLNESEIAFWYCG